MARLFRHRASPPRLGSRGQPEESRAAILQAAAKEFAELGIAGARTDAIAREARVNKALLYYYFRNKETLYGAVLDQAFSGMKTQVFHVLDSDLPPREKIMAYVGAYFDFIASNHIYPKLMQREMMRAREGQSEHIDRLVKTYFRPIYKRVGELLHNGTVEGAFRPVDPAHFVSSMVAMIVFYFSSAPVMQRIPWRRSASPSGGRQSSILFPRRYLSLGSWRPSRFANQESANECS
jgi:TetR/AcrR family transcriptional regulator